MQIVQKVMQAEVLIYPCKNCKSSTTKPLEIPILIDKVSECKITTIEDVLPVGR